MAVIKLVEDYAVSQLRKDVRDAMMLAGEQSILLGLYHAGDKDAVPCPQCGDDIYESPEMDCTSCLGTMFDGGVRTAMKVWSLYTDHEVSEQLGPRGDYQPDARSVTFECFPIVTEHDILVRVKGWASDGTPSVLEGFYMLQKVQRRSLRTGNRFGQANWDVVSQKAQVSELNSSMKAITTYPILGKVFEESIQLIQGSTSHVPTGAVLTPDVKVVYFPFEAAPGGISPEPAPIDAAFVFRQGIPAATWTIHHNLGYEPSVSVMVNGEEVDADVDYPTNDVVVITFNTPQSGIARLT